MAVIVITIQDMPDGKVKILTQPTMADMLGKTKSKPLSSAEGYVFKVLNEIRKESKRAGRTVIDVPRLIT